MLAIFGHESMKSDNEAFGSATLRGYHIKLNPV